MPRTRNTLPRASFRYYDATRGSLDQYGQQTCGFLQNADYVPESSAGANDDFFIFYPYGDPNVGAAPNNIPFSNGTILVYYPSLGYDFGDPQATVAVNLNGGGTPLVDALAYGFGAGFVDLAGGYVYFIGSRQIITNNQWDTNTLQVRASIAGLRTKVGARTASTYQKVDLAGLGLSRFGYYFGFVSGRYAYYMPTTDNTLGLINPFALRFDTQGSGGFTNLANWITFDMRTIAGLTGPQQGQAGGMQSGIVGPAGKVYYIPFGSGFSLMTVYDPAAGAGDAFTSAASWSFADLQALGLTTQQPGGLRSYTGALVIANRYILFIPWKRNDIVNADFTQSACMFACLLYDTQSGYGLTDKRSWTVFDLTRVSNGRGMIAAGYEFGVMTASGDALLIPTGIYSNGSHKMVPYLLWRPDVSNVAGGSVVSSFTNAAQWRAYQDPNWATAADPAASNVQHNPAACGGALNTKTGKILVAAIGGSNAPGITNGSVANKNRGIVTEITLTAA